MRVKCAKCYGKRTANCSECFAKKTLLGSTIKVCWKILKKKNIVIGEELWRRRDVEKENIEKEGDVKKDDF